MDTDIRDEIERSFGDGPALSADDELMARAHGALRRRRIAESAAAAVVTVVALSGALLLSGGDDADEVVPAGPPGTHGSPPTTATDTSSPTSSPASSPGSGPAVPEPQVIVDRGVRAQWGPMSQIDGPHVSPKLRIIRTWEDPWGLDLPDGGWSFALVYDAPGIPRTWWVGYLDHAGGSAAAISADQAGGLDLAAWVAAQRTLYGPPGARRGANEEPPATPPGGWPGMTDLALVRFVEGTERLEPLDAVTLLRQRAHPDLPASWAGPDDRSAVAEVVFEDVRYYVLARSSPGEPAPQFVAVKATRGGATLDDFLAFARDRYAEGGGGLL